MKKATVTFEDKTAVVDCDASKIASGAALIAQFQREIASHKMPFTVTVMEE